MQEKINNIFQFFSEWAFQRLVAYIADIQRIVVSLIPCVSPDKYLKKKVK